MTDFEYRKLGRDYWQTKLRQGSGLEQCRLPTYYKDKNNKVKGIKFFGEHVEVTLQLSESSLNANMQSDAAAFDAWALAFLTHCGAEKIRIEIEGVSDTDRPHFQRFLYRARRFSELFPVHGNFTKYFDRAKALDGKIHKVLNQPEERQASDEGEGLSKGTEADLEKALLISKEFRAAFDLNPKKVMRQWPVGLFEKAVRRSNMIFTGGKSAIDLIGISNSGDTLLLFELKKEGNRKAGAISELLFYTNVMRDALRSYFEFGGGNGEHAIYGSDIKACKYIRSILIAPDFHPLVWNDTIDREKSVISKLNAAVKQKWKDFPACFEVARIVSSSAESDFKFRIES